MYLYLYLYLLLSVFVVESVSAYTFADTTVCLSVCVLWVCCVHLIWVLPNDNLDASRRRCVFLSSPPSMATLEVVCLFFRLCLTLPVAVVVAIVTTKFMLKYFLAWNWFLGLFIKARIYYSGVGGHKYFVYNYLIYADFLTALTVCI